MKIMNNNKINKNKYIYFDSEKACELSKHNEIKNRINLLTEEEHKYLIKLISAIKKSCYNGVNELLVSEDTELHKCLTPDIIDILKLKGFVVFEEYDRSVSYYPGPYLGYVICW